MNAANLMHLAARVKTMPQILLPAARPTEIPADAAPTGFDASAGLDFRDGVLVAGIAGHAAWAARAAVGWFDWPAGYLAAAREWIGLGWREHIDLVVPHLPREAVTPDVAAAVLRSVAAGPDEVSPAWIWHKVAGAPAPLHSSQPPPRPHCLHIRRGGVHG